MLPALIWPGRCEWERKHHWFPSLRHTNWIGFRQCLACHRVQDPTGRVMPDRDWRDFVESVQRP